MHSSSLPKIGAVSVVNAGKIFIVNLPCLRIALNHDVHPSGRTTFSTQPPVGNIFNLIIMYARSHSSPQQLCTDSASQHCRQCTMLGARRMTGNQSCLAMSRSVQKKPPVRRSRRSSPSTRSIPKPPLSPNRSSSQWSTSRRPHTSGLFSRIKYALSLFSGIDAADMILAS